MRFIRILSFTAALASGLAAANLVCESTTATGSYNWNDETKWSCYGPGKVLVANEYPGKNPTNHQYVVTLGATTGGVPEFSVNVNATLGVLGRPFAQWAITALADNGAGAVRVTTTANTVANGDKVFCFGSTGAGANSVYGVWTAVVPSTTPATNAFDLQGSTFASSTISGGYCEFPAALKRMGANNATTVGKWKVNAGVTIVLRGDVVEDWTYNTRVAVDVAPNWDRSFWLVRCGDPTNGGCTWVWDGAGPAYYQTRYNGRTNNDAPHMAFYARGTPTQRAVFTCIDVEGVNAAAGAPCATARQGRFSGYRNFRATAGLDMDYVDISYLGGSGASSYWTVIYADVNTVFKLTHFSIRNSGSVLFPAYVPMPASQFAVAYGEFGSGACADTGNACMLQFNPAPGTTLTIGPAVTFLPKLAMTMQGAGPTGTVRFDRTYMTTAPNIAASSPGSAMVDSIVAKAATNPGIISLGIDNFTNNFVFQPHIADGNPHNLEIPGAWSGLIMSQVMTVDGNVFQGDGGYSDGAGQMLDNHDYSGVHSSVTAPAQIIVKNNVFIPSHTYDGGNTTPWSSSNSMTFLHTNPGASVAVWKFHNNTTFSTTDGLAAPLWLNHAGNWIGTGAIAEWRCNVAVISPGTAGSSVLIGTESPENANSAVDAVVPSGIHHNAGFGKLATHSDANATNSVGTYYHAKLSAPPSGAGDQFFPGRMPRVADRTRRLRTWAMQKYGATLTDWMNANHPGTELNAVGNNADSYVLEFLRSDVAGAGPTRLLDIPDLVAWVRAGWTLNEPALYKACGDGTHIGAAVAATPINPAVSGTIVARGDAWTAAPCTTALD